jgi:hypothetical protein
MTNPLLSPWLDLVLRSLTLLALFTGAAALLGLLHS